MWPGMLGLRPMVLPGVANASAVPHRAIEHLLQVLVLAFVGLGEIVRLVGKLVLGQHLLILGLDATKKRLQGVVTGGVSNRVHVYVTVRCLLIYCLFMYKNAKSVFTFFVSGIRPHCDYK